MTDCFTEEFEGNFTIIHNELIRDSNLSCRAFKLLCIGLSHRKKWKFFKEQIATCFKESSYQVDEAMKELRALGYLHTKAKNSEDGKFIGHTWYWFRKPITDAEFKKRYRNTENADFGEIGASENPGDIRKPTYKKTNFKKEQQPPKADSSASPPVVVFSCLENLNIRPQLKAKLSRQYDEATVAKAVEVLNNSDPDDTEAFLVAAIKEGWDSPPDEAQLLAKNTAYLTKLSDSGVDGRKLGAYTVTVHPEGVIFRHTRLDGSKNKSFDRRDRRFIDKVLAFIEKLKTGN
jgi:hypothetical protein